MCQRHLEEKCSVLSNMKSHSIWQRSNRGANPRQEKTVRATQRHTRHFFSGHHHPRHCKSLEIVAIWIDRPSSPVLFLILKRDIDRDKSCAGSVEKLLKLKEVL